MFNWCSPRDSLQMDYKKKTSDRNSMLKTCSLQINDVNDKLSTHSKRQRSVQTCWLRAVIILHGWNQIHSGTKRCLTVLLSCSTSEENLQRPARTQAPKARVTSRAPGAPRRDPSRWDWELHDSHALRRFAFLTPNQLINYALWINHRTVTLAMLVMHFFFYVKPFNS